LKSLGYLSVGDQSAEVDEQIQMHADTLYHKMLEREAQIEAAKAEGRPVPDFAPLIPKTAAPAGSKADPEIDADTQKQWYKKLQKVSAQDREAEETALKAEQRANLEVANKLQGMWDEQAKERAARKEKGEDTIGDKLRSLVGK
jgi:hypothetical protein